MQKSSSRRSSTRSVGSAIVAKLMVAGCFVGSAAADDREATVAVPASAYEKVLSRMEQMEAELKSLKSKQVKQAKKQKKLEEQSASPQVVVVDRAAEVPNDASDSSYIPTRHHGGVYPSGGLKDDVDKPVTARLGAFYGEAGVTVLKLFGSRDTAMVFEYDNSNFHQAVVFDHKFEAGGRYEVGYKSNRGLGLAARFWHYKTHAKASQAVGNGISEVAASFWGDNPSINMSTSSDGDRIDAERSLSFRTLDVEASMAGALNNGIRLTFAGGVRFADIDMLGKWTQFDASQGDIDNYVEFSNKFRGAGPVVGFSASAPLYRVGALQVDAFGLARTSLLFGSGTLEAFDTDGGPNDPRDDSLRIDRNGFAVTGEVQIGLEAIWKLSRAAPLELFARGQVEAQYWSDLGSVSAADSQEDDAAEGNSVVDANIGMYGGTFMVGVRTPLGQ